MVGVCSLFFFFKDGAFFSDAEKSEVARPSGVFSSESKLVNRRFRRCNKIESKKDRFDYKKLWQNSKTKIGKPDSAQERGMLRKAFPAQNS